MLFATENLRLENTNTLNNFFTNTVDEFEPVVTIEDEAQEEESNVSKYIHSLVCSQYQKSIEDIENTVVGNKLKRKRNLQQVMRESFFYGANRFGNNFIA